MIIRVQPKQTPQAQTAPPAVSRAAGVGTTTPGTVGSPVAPTATLAIAPTTSASALPGPENDPQFSVCLLSFLPFCPFPGHLQSKWPIRRKKTQVLMRPPSRMAARRDGFSSPLCRPFGSHLRSRWLNFWDQFGKGPRLLELRSLSTQKPVKFFKTENQNNQTDSQHDNPSTPDDESENSINDKIGCNGFHRMLFDI